MEYFSFILPPLIWILLGVSLVVGLIALAQGFFPLRIVKRNSEPEGVIPAPAPKVSIIALSREDFDPSLFIEQVTVQNYPDYEVIIVHEATSAANEAFAEQYAWQPQVSEEAEDKGAKVSTGCRDVKFCFYPPGAHALSPDKLALSIGIKASSGDVIVTTSTDCIIPSNEWLSAIMRRFRPGVDFVLGYAAYDYDALPSFSRSLQRFIHLMTAGQWLSAALSDTPVRGDRYNLAYRKELFYKSKGFANTNDLMHGEDDIFVAANANEANTRVELSEASTVYPYYGDDAQRMMTNSRDRYRFTSERLPRSPFVSQGVASACQWILIITAVCASIFALPNFIPAILATVVVLAIWISEALIYKRMAQTLGDSRGWWLTPLWLLLRPIDNFTFDLSRRNVRFSNYTLRRQ